jgi:hypothetical protein
VLNPKLNERIAVKKGDALRLVRTSELTSLFCESRQCHDQTRFAI